MRIKVACSVPKPLLVAIRIFQVRDPLFRSLNSSQSIEKPMTLFDLGAVAK